MNTISEQTNQVQGNSVKTPPVSIDCKAEHRLEKINKIVLIISLVCAFFLLSEGVNALVDYENPILYFLGTAAVVTSSLLVWAVIKVLINISLNLHNLNSK